MNIFDDVAYRLRRSAQTIAVRPRMARADCVSLILDAAREIGEPLQARRFDEYAAQRQLPGSQWMQIEFGEPWSAIVRRLGINPGRSNAGVRSDFIPASDCLVAVRRCRDLLGWIPTYTDYEAWQRSVPSAPCGSVVRRRLGGWGSVIRALEAERASS